MGGCASYQKVIKNFRTAGSGDQKQGPTELSPCGFAQAAHPGSRSGLLSVDTRLPRESRGSGGHHCAFLDFLQTEAKRKRSMERVQNVRKGVVAALQGR